MVDDRQFVPTGVPGLDHVLRGGFLREGFYLVQGDPGLARGHGDDEQQLLFARESAEVLDEPRQALVRGQRAGLLVVNVRAERGQELFAGLVLFAAAQCDLEGCIALALLPGGGPEPRLCRVDDLLRPEQDPVRYQLDLHRIALLEMDRLTDLRRDRDLPFTPKAGDRCTRVHDSNYSGK